MAHLIEGRWEPTVSVGLSRAQRRPCRYQAYVPDRVTKIDVALPPDTAADVSDAERAIQHLNTAGSTVASLEALARLLLRAEAVASSRIEGLEVGARWLARAEAARDLGEPVDDSTAAAVLGNVEAMAVAVDDVATRDQIAVEDLLAIHHALMRHSDRPELGGRIRTTQNWIGGNSFNPCGAAFVPPPPGEVSGLVEDLVTFLNGDRYPPLVQAALAHAQFETIHPFADGNGRTGRALIHVVLRRRGLAPRFVPPISLVLATRSRDYLAGLTATRYLGSPDGSPAQVGLAFWIATFVAAALRAAADAERFGVEVDRLVQTWRDRAQPIRANSAVDRLLRVLPAAAVLTVATAARLIDRSVVATNQAINHLTEVGVLKQTTVGRRNRAYEAVGLLDAFTGFECALASPTEDTHESAPVRPVPYRPVHLRRPSG